MDAEDVSEDYRSSLCDLTVNSKPLISMLTMLAEENQKFAQHIVEVIEAHIQKVKALEKLPALYLIDSILKNVRESQYGPLFTQNIANIFCHVFEQVDEKTRQAMYKLRQTWTDIFPQRKLYALDVRVNQIDPAWPITAAPAEALSAPVPSSIHVNPKFLSAARPSVEDSLQGDHKQSDADEMRRQLKAKQEELLKLQQQRLDLELAHAKAQLEKFEKGKQQPATVSTVVQNVLRKSEELQDPRINRQRETMLRDPRRVSNVVQAHVPSGEESGNSQKGNGWSRQEQRVGDSSNQLATSTKREAVLHVSAAGRGQNVADDTKLFSTGSGNQTPAASGVSVKPLFGMEILAKRISPIRDRDTTSRPNTATKDRDERVLKRDTTDYLSIGQGKTVLFKPKDGASNVKKGVYHGDPRQMATSTKIFNVPVSVASEDRDERLVIPQLAKTATKGKSLPASGKTILPVIDTGDKRQEGCGINRLSVPQMLLDKDERIPNAERYSAVGADRTRVPGLLEAIIIDKKDVDMRSPTLQVKDAVRVQDKKERRDAASEKRKRTSELRSSPIRAKEDAAKQHQAGAEAVGLGGVKRRLSPSTTALSPHTAAGSSSGGTSWRAAASKIATTETASIPSVQRGASTHDKDERVKAGDSIGGESQDKDDRVKEPKRSALMSLKIPKRLPADRAYRRRSGSPDHFSTLRPRSRSPRAHLHLPRDSTTALLQENQYDLDMRPNKMPPPSSDSPVQSTVLSHTTETTTAHEVPLSEDVDMRKVMPTQQMHKGVHTMDINVCDDVDLRLQMKKRQPPCDETQVLPLTKKGRSADEDEYGDFDGEQEVGGLLGAQDQDYRCFPAGPPPVSPAAHMGWTAFKENHPRTFPYDLRRASHGSDGDVDLRSHNLPALRTMQPLHHFSGRPLPGCQPRDPMRLLSDTESLRSRAEWRFHNGDISREDYQDALIQLEELQRLHPAQQHPGSEWSDMDRQGSILIPTNSATHGFTGSSGPVSDIQFRLPAGPFPMPSRTAGSTGQLSPGSRLHSWEWPQAGGRVHTRRPPQHGQHSSLPGFVPPPPSLSDDEHDHMRRVIGSAPNLLQHAQRPRNTDVLSEVVIDGKPYELTLGLKARYISIGGRKWMVRADKDTREILIDEHCYYRLGDPIRDVMLGGQPHRIFFHGSRRHMWIDGLQYDVRVDAPPQPLLIGGRSHLLRIDSHSNKLLIDGNDMGECSHGQMDIEIGGVFHRVSFEPPPKQIMIDNKLCELNFDGPLPVVVIDGRMHGIRFDGPPREIFIDDTPFMVRMDQPTRIKLGRRAHMLAFGGPGHEVMIDGKQYEVMFNGPSREVNIGGSSHTVRLCGDPPGVKILGEVVQGEPGPAVGLVSLQPRVPLLPTFNAGVLSGHVSEPMAPWHTSPTAAALGMPPHGSNMDSVGLAVGAKVSTAAVSVANPPAQVNINDLFSKLLQYGIIAKKDADTTAVITTATSTEIATSAALAVEEHMEDVPDLTDLSEEKLKRKHNGVLQRLYIGTQCATCGMRFLSSEVAKYNQHLDWHFRQNKREKESPKATLCRKWYFPVDVWVTYEEFTDADESNIFLCSVSTSGTINNGVTNVVHPETVSCPVATGNEKDDACYICGDPFEQFWDEEEEAWHLKDAIRVKNKTYHPICYEDACETSMIDTVEPASADSALELTPTSLSAVRAVADTSTIDAAAPAHASDSLHALTAAHSASAVTAAHAASAVTAAHSASAVTASALLSQDKGERTLSSELVAIASSKQEDVPLPSACSATVPVCTLDVITVKIEPLDCDDGSRSKSVDEVRPDGVAGDIVGEYEEPGTPVQDERVV